MRDVSGAKHFFKIPYASLFSLSTSLKAGQPQQFTNSVKQTAKYELSSSTEFCCSDAFQLLLIITDSIVMDVF